MITLRFGRAASRVASGGALTITVSSRSVFSTWASRPVVEPTELPETDILANLRGMGNALILDTDTLGRLVVSQLDGGLTQTAYALLSDLIAIRKSASEPVTTRTR